MAVISGLRDKTQVKSIYLYRLIPLCGYKPGTMNRLLLLVLGVFAVGGNAFIGDEDGPLSDKPMLKMMMMRNLFGGGALGGGQLGDGPLSERPVLRMMLMRRMLGGGDADGLGGAGPLARALGSDNAPPPILRAMLMKRLMTGQGPLQQAGGESPMRNLLMFRILGQKMGEKIIEKAVDLKEEHRVWTFQTTLSCDCALEYVDEHGKMQGFALDLVNEVCKEAGRKCVITYDDSSHCYTHHHGEHSRAGVGLLGKNYDVCLNWMKTEERGHSVGFTRSYWKEGAESHFYVKAGNPHGFDPHKLAGTRIGFVDGWAADPYCLKHHSSEEQIAEIKRDKPTLVYEDSEGLIDHLSTDKLDAVFVLDAYVSKAQQLGFEPVGDAVLCGSGYSHGMTRKDSHAIAWFDETLNHMFDTGAYYKLCKHAKDVHGHKGDIKCILKDEH
ncbi:uncharacterized protein [Ptychodera flava]|uniref:uncharacterized protein isoform X2 n=1 Tax=Ptychodera flava TaxID=63121 RepID=UPI00396A54D9